MFTLNSYENQRTLSFSYSCNILLFFVFTGLEIATDTVANATNIFSLVTKNSG